MIWHVSMIDLGRMSNRWGVVMVIIISYLYCVNVIWLIRHYNKWWSVRGRYDEYTVLRPIINTHENMSTGCGNVCRRIWGLMEEDGTNVAIGVMVDGWKWYLRCFRCGVVWCHLWGGRSRGVKWIMCMGRRVRDVCSHVCILHYIYIYISVCLYMFTTMCSYLFQPCQSRTVQTQRCCNSICCNGSWLYVSKWHRRRSLLAFEWDSWGQRRRSNWFRSPEHSFHAAATSTA